MHCGEASSFLCRPRPSHKMHYKSFQALGTWTKHFAHCLTCLVEMFLTNCFAKLLSMFKSFKIKLKEKSRPWVFENQAFV